MTTLLEMEHKLVIQNIPKSIMKHGGEIGPITESECTVEHHGYLLVLPLYTLHSTTVNQDPLESATHCGMIICVSFPYY